MGRETGEFPEACEPALLIYTAVDNSDNKETLSQANWKDRTETEGWDPVAFLSAIPSSHIKSKLCHTDATLEISKRKKCIYTYYIYTEICFLFFIGYFFFFLFCGYLNIYFYYFNYNCLHVYVSGAGGLRLAWSWSYRWLLQRTWVLGT